MVYSNGKIYRLICEETNRQYIGSTCNPLRKRLYQHKRKENQCITKDFINPIIVLIEDYPCDRKEQLLMRERHFIEIMECVNKWRPIILKEERKEIKRINSKKYRQNNKEYQKEYYEKNREELKEYSKEYFEKNKEGKKQKSNEYYEKNKDEINRKRREKRAAAKELKNISK